MKILWIKSDFVIPLDTGGKIRSYNIIQQLAKIDEVTYLSFVDQYHTSEHKKDMQKCVQKVISVFKKALGMPGGFISTLSIEFDVVLLPSESNNVWIDKG